MVIPHLFTIRRRSCPMTRRDKLWSFCTFFPSADDRVRWHGEINCGHSAPFRHLETIVSDGTQRQIMVFPHLFAIQRRSCPMARRVKLWCFYAFCQPEATCPMTSRDKLWSFRTFSPSADSHARWHAKTNYGHSVPFRHLETIVSGGTQRQIMVIMRLLSSRGGKPNDMWRQIMVIPHLFAIRRRSCPMARRDKLWSFCAFCHPETVSPMTWGDKSWSFCIISPSGDDHVRWNAEINYGHFRLLSSRGGEPNDMRLQIMVIPHLFAIRRRSCPMERNLQALDLLHPWSPLLFEDQWQRNGEGVMMIGDATSRRR